MYLIDLNENYSMIHRYHSNDLQIFWFFGLNVWKLIYTTFAVFGFFDFFGRQLEIAYMRLVVVLMYYTNTLYNIIKNFIVSLIAKIKSKLKSK